MNNPPAFPIPSPEMTIDGQGIQETQGMTLRDYFAVAALQGMIAIGYPDDEKRVQKAYQIADQMLEEREK